jgi:Ca2+-binding RTX toxin-like protein
VAVRRRSSVNYWTADDSAGASDGDYVPAAGALNFGLGEESKSITVSVIADTVAEPIEMLFMLLSGATGGATIVTPLALGTIVDDDYWLDAGTVVISDATVAEGDDGTRAMLFTVTRSGGTAAFSVSYATANGTAAAGSDYVATSGTLAFSVGETSRTIAVTINGDTAIEGNEAFVVGLSGAPPNVTIGDGLAVGTIRADELVPDHGFVSRGPVTIPGSRLLANDPPAFTVVEVSNPVNGTALVVAGGVQFDATETSSVLTASFEYAASNGALIARPATVWLDLVTTNDRSNKVTIATLANDFSVIDGLDGNDKLTAGAGMDRLLGGAGNDELRGGAHSDLLLGGSGEDKLWGEDSNDSLQGGDGNDRLDGGAGLDIMFGGAGNDTYQVDSLPDAVIEQTVSGIDDGGVDLVQSTISWTLGAFLENLDLLGTAAINGTGNGLANRINGNAGNNWLLGAGGDDILDGKGGVDTMDGGDGDDTYYADSDDVVRDTGTSGGDRLVFSSNVLVLASGTGIESIEAAAGTRNIKLTGDSLANRMTGNDGNNVLRGLGGDDQIRGGLGDDTLEGGLGRDRLTGGDGADIFTLMNGDSPATDTAAYDTITDLVSGIDKLDLSTIGSLGLPTLAYAETVAASTSFGSARTAALAEMAVGTVSVVFVATAADGWLFWNTDADLHAPEQVVRLTGLSNTGLFAHGDLM